MSLQIHLGSESVLRKDCSWPQSTVRTSDTVPPSTMDELLYFHHSDTAGCLFTNNTFIPRI